MLAVDFNLFVFLAEPFEFEDWGDFCGRVILCGIEEEVVVFVGGEDWDFAFDGVANAPDDTFAECGDEEALFAWFFIHAGVGIFEGPE